MKLRLLVVCPYYPPHTGGVEQYTAALNASLIKDPSVATITVLTSALPANTPAWQQSGRLTIIRYPAVELVANFPVPAVWKRGYWQAVRQARQSRPTLVFSHTRFFVSTLMAWRLARQLKVKWLHIEHGSDFVQTSNAAVRAAARLYDQTVGRAVLRSADGLIAISQAVADFIQDVAGRQATVIYRGMDTAAMRTVSSDPVWRRQFKEKVVVCYVGRLVSGKGIFDLVAAAAQLKAEPIGWLVVGDGPAEPALQEAVKAAGLGDHFHFVGPQPPVKALAAIKAADIFINPSYTEGLPTTVLEAALLGRPVVATDVGGTREIIRDGQSGYLVPPHQPERLASAIAVLAADQLQRQQFGQTAARMATTKFDWRRNTKVFLDYCQAIVKT